MQHRVRFQYRPKGSARPLDYEQGFDLTTDDGPVLLPSIGDHVEVQGYEMDGVVDNRTFIYLTIGGQKQCLITVVLTDNDIDSDRIMNPPAYFKMGADDAAG